MQLIVADEAGRELDEEDVHVAVYCLVGLLQRYQNVQYVLALVVERLCVRVRARMLELIHFFLRLWASSRDCVCTRLHERVGPHAYGYILSVWYACVSVIARVQVCYVYVYMWFTFVSVSLSARNKKRGLNLACIVYISSQKSVLAPFARTLRALQMSISFMCVCVRVNVSACTCAHTNVRMCVCACVLVCACVFLFRHIFS